MRDSCGICVRDVEDIGDVIDVAYLGDVRGEGDMADVRDVGYDSNGIF